MKSKFKNRIVLWDDKHYRNSRTKSPYLFVLDIEKKYRPKLSGGDRIVVRYIDRLGNIDKIETTRHYLYNKMKALESSEHKHLLRDFVIGAFK